MLIVCPICASEYNLDAEQLGSEGRRVRCFNCHADWFARPGQRGSSVLGASSERLSAQDLIEDEWARAAEADEDVAQAQNSFSSGGDEAEHPSDAMIASDAVIAPEPEHLEQAVPVVVDAPSSARREIPRRKGHDAPLPIKKRPSQVSAGGLAICGAFLLSFLLWQRDVVVRYAPALATPLEKIGLGVNIRGLEFDKIASELVVDPSGRFLVVQSTVRNVTSRLVFIPPIEAVVRDASAKPVYTWATEPTKTSLAPGETLNFRARLASPPEEGHDVVLRFQRSSAPMKTAQH